MSHVTIARFVALALALIFTEVTRAINELHGDGALTVGEVTEELARLRLK